jgi:peptidoglycan/LPS O-acetylase OafA/YrhL
MTTSPIYEPREATAEPVTSAFVAKLAGSRLPCLDGLRAIAAYLVVLAHIGILQRLAPDNWGPFAVNIFFVISGFLITFLLIREFEKNSKVSIRKFYLRRTLRIFPAFYVCWGFTLVLGIAFHRKFGPWEPVATFFYMGDYYRAFHDSPNLLMGIAWSLGIEEKFYLLWPMVFVALAGRWAKLFKCCLAGVGLIWLNKLVLMHVVHPPYRYFEYAFDTRGDVILVGCALALATRLPRAQAWFAAVARRPGWMLPTIGLLIGTVVAVSPENRDVIPAYFTYVMAAQIVLLPILFVQLISWSHVPFVRALDSKIARTLGDLSYGIYLYHYPLLWLARRFLQSHIRFSIFVLVELLLPLLAAYLSRRLVEEPFLRLKDRLA